MFRRKVKKLRKEISTERLGQIKILNYTNNKSKLILFKLVENNIWGSLDSKDCRDISTMVVRRGTLELIETQTPTFIHIYNLLTSLLTCARWSLLLHYIFLYCHQSIMIFLLFIYFVYNLIFIYMRDSYLFRFR